jgi:hypothetical protein
VHNSPGEDIAVLLLGYEEPMLKMLKTLMTSLMTSMTTSLDCHP